MSTYHITSPSGEEYVITNPDDTKAQQAASQLADSFGPATSAVGAAGRGALDALPFGDKAAAGIESAVGGDTYKNYLSQIDKLIGADKEQHPIAHDVGEVAGTVAPFAIPGVGEALGADSLAGRVGVGAGIGALQGASNNRDSASLPSDVLKGAATGAVLNPVVGGVTDAIGGLFRSGGSKVAQAISSEGDTLHVPHIPDATPPEAAPQPSADMPPHVPSSAAHGGTMDPTGVPLDSSMNEMTAGRQKQGLFPSPEEWRAEVLAGQLGGSPRQLRSLPGKDPIQTLNHMYDVIQSNPAQDGSPLISGMDRYSDRLQKFIDLQSRSGKVIGDTIKNSGIPPVPTQTISDGLGAALKFPNPDDAAQMKSVIDTLGKYSQADGTPGAISFQRLQQLKSDLGNEAFNGQGNKVLQAAYHVVDAAQDNELNKVGAAINKPAFDSAKSAYQMTSRAIPMLKMATTRSLAKGYSSFGTPLAALVTGHPVAALGSLMKEPLERMAGASIFNAAGSGAGVGSVAENVASKAGSDIATLINHPAMAPYKQAFATAAKGATNPAEVQKSNAVTDFLMSQRDPKYAAAKQAALEANQ